jgi:hypothetical protein
VDVTPYDFTFRCYAIWFVGIFHFFTFVDVYTVWFVDNFWKFAHDITLNVYNRILKFRWKLFLLTTFHWLMSTITKFIGIWSTYRSFIISHIKSRKKHQIWLITVKTPIAQSYLIRIFDFRFHETFEVIWVTLIFYFKILDSLLIHTMIPNWIIFWRFSLILFVSSFYVPIGTATATFIWNQKFDFRYEGILDIISERFGSIDPTSIYIRGTEIKFTFINKNRKMYPHWTLCYYLHILSNLENSIPKVSKHHFWSNHIDDHVFDWCSML